MENIKNIVVGTIAVISGVIGSHVVKWWGTIASTTAFLESSAARTNALMVTTTQNRIAAEVALEEAKNVLLSASDSERLAAKARVVSAEIDLKKAVSSEEIAQEHLKLVELKVADAKRLADATASAATLLKITKQRLAAEIELEVAQTNLLIAQNEERAASTYNSAVAAREKTKAAQITYANAEKKLATVTAKEIAAQEAAKAAAVQSSSVKSATWWSSACAKMKVAGAKLIVSLKAMWASFVPMIIITAIAAIIGKFKTMYDESKRIKNIFSDYKKESQISGYTQEVVILKQQLKIMNDKHQSQENINRAQAQLQKMLGVEHKSQDELNKLVAKRVDLLKETARADYHSRKVVESSEVLREVGNKTYSGRTVKEMAPDWAMAKGDLVKEERFKAKYKVKMTDSWGWENGLRNDLDSYIEQAKILKHSTEELDKSTVAANKLISIPTGGDTDDKKKKTPLQKEQESFNKQYEELKAELEIGKITQAEYNKNLGELNIKMYAQAKGTGEKEVLESEYLKERKKAAEEAIKNQDKNAALVEFEKVQKDYNEKIKEARAQEDNGLMSKKELNENIASLSLEAAKSAAGIKGIGDEAEVFISTMKLNAKVLTAPIKIKPRDTTFDYKKTKVDIVSEDLDKAKELVEKYKDQAKDLGVTMTTELNKAMGKVTTLEDALKLAEVQEDIKNFSKELNEIRWDGFKNAVSNIDGMVSAFQRLQDAFDPESEADGWERLMAIWNMMTSVVDGFMSVIETIRNITELTNKLTQAKETEAAIDTATTATKITNMGTETAAEVTTLATQTTAEVMANAAKTTAATTAMAAETTAAYAGIPFVGIALAGAQIAAMKAMIMAAAIPFAKGGIITDGPTSGDRILARVNAGEMILNGTQQSNLFNAINSGRLGGGGNMSSTVTTRVRAKDLILTINNELKSQGKKPIS